MRFLDRYPIIVTESHRDCRDFWTKHFGFAVVFENDWFAYLAAEGAAIAFMSPDHPSSPPGPEPYEAGISFELEVADAAAALAEFEANGGKPDYPLTDEAFGQRRFSFQDPSGLWVNVVQQLAMPD
jgi:catechol 2,3-dioxygenase-like lactoylglutathione lyase family enzyme